MSNCMVVRMHVCLCDVVGRGSEDRYRDDGHPAGRPGLAGTEDATDGDARGVDRDLPAASRLGSRLAPSGAVQPPRRQLIQLQGKG